MLGMTKGKSVILSLRRIHTEVRIKCDLNLQDMADCNSTHRGFEVLVLFTSSPKDLLFLLEKPDKLRLFDYRIIPMNDIKERKKCNE